MKSLPPSARIKHLDGLRGLAILLVTLFHAYARWPDLVPYGNLLEPFPLARFGYVGVQLFFLISGYVILMTLEQCPTAGEFLRRRWLRLFPAMLACSALIYLSAGLFHERPAGQPQWLSLLPGLLFIEPDWLTTATGLTVPPLEGAFWSLYVEFKFYVFAAGVYYALGRHALIAALLAAFALTLIAPTTDRLPWLHDSIPPGLFTALLDALSFRHFGWFAAGAIFRIHTQSQRPLWWLLGLATALLSAASMTDPAMAPGAVAAAALVALGFAVSWLSAPMQGLLNAPPLQFLGLISYPLYLLHENMMISMIIKFGHFVPVPLQVLTPVLALTIVALIALGVTRWIEPRIKALLMRANRAFRV